MGKKKVEVEVEVEAVVEDTKGSASVEWSGGVRTYTKEVHGKDFKKFAEEFAEKKGGKVV
jgi:hypothetical protein